jgi:hypothetical protein
MRIEGEYGTTIITGPPARAEHQKPTETRIDRADVRRMTNLNDDEINSRLFGFPASQMEAGRLVVGVAGAVRMRTRQVWQLTEVVRWLGDMRAFVARFP